MEDVGIFYDHSVNFGIFVCYLVQITHFGMLRQEKSGNPAADKVVETSSRPSDGFCRH
jgi:hypothetical protein